MRNAVLVRISRRFLFALAIGAAIFCGTAKADVVTAPADASQDVAPGTLHDAVALMGQTYGFDIVGLDLVGDEAPDWPPTAQTPGLTLKRLLRHYGYVEELKPGTGSVDERLPSRVTVVINPVEAVVTATIENGQG